MGLKGLYSVIKDHQSLWTNINTIPRPAKLVIDGRTIANSIYSDCKFDGLCAGQYTEYYEKIFRLFFRLRSFGFDIMILMECGKQENNDSDIYDKRMARWLQFKKSLKNGEPYSRLPLLGYYIFIKAAKTLDLKLLPTDIDTTTALLGVAKLSNAYILTNRNDSFICDIPGVLTLNNISWEGEELSGKFYSFSRFLSFTNLSPSFIPLLFLLASPETYLSNNYCVQELNQAFSRLTSAPLPEGDRIFFRRRFDRALSYLQAHAHEYMLAYQQLKSRLIERFHAILDESLDLANTKIYNPEKLGCLDYGKHNFGMDYSSTLRGHSDISPQLLFRVDYGFWGALGLNDKCVFVSTRAENFAEVAAGLISRHIRSIIYGILSKDDVCVKEHLRSKEPLNHKLDEVAPVREYKDIKIPYILSIDAMGEQEKTSFLFHCLDFDPASFLDIPEYWHLPVLSVHFWLSRRGKERRVSEAACRLLILCFLACSNGEDLRKELKPLYISHVVVIDNVNVLQQIAEWQFVVFDIMALKSLLGMDNLLLSPERLYNGRFYFSMLINDDFTNQVKRLILINEDTFNLYERMSEIALAPILSPSSS